MKNDIYTAYRVDGDGNYWFHDGRSIRSDLAPGFYQVERDIYTDQLYLEPRERLSDGIVPIPNPSAEEALGITQKFLSGAFRESLEAVGMVHKLSLLLWGVHGTSKSVTTYQIIDTAVENGWVVLDGTHELRNLAKAIKMIKIIDPHQGVVVIWEEFDNLIATQEEKILQLLDGKDQFPDVLYLLTTNHIKKIPPRILERTRRISLQVMFTFPGEDERRAYFEGKIPASARTDIDLDAWVEATDGFSIDNCAQVIVGVLAYKRSLKDVITDLALRRALTSSNEEDEEDEEELLICEGCGMPEDECECDD